MSSNKTSPQISIGMPLYNGEKFIKKRLDNILSQTFTDFELIISDDSSDSTPIICQEYAKKDKRIQYIHQIKKMGAVWNFNFVLKQANGKYFAWAAVDDVWTNDFLEKNFKVLESDDTVVGSIGKVERYGIPISEFKDKLGDSFIVKQYKKLRRFFRPFGVKPILDESYEKRVSRYLRNRADLSIYALFRRKELVDSIILEPFAWYFSVVIKVLKHGKLNVTDEVLWSWYTGGGSSKGIIHGLKIGEIRLLEVIFPWSAFIIWCYKNLGTKIFLKNLDYFIWLNILGVISNSFSIIQWIKHQLIYKTKE